MNFLSCDFLYHRGIFKTTYRGTWDRSNVLRLGPLCLRFQPFFAWKRISDRGVKLQNCLRPGMDLHLFEASGRLASNHGVSLAAAVTDGGSSPRAMVALAIGGSTSATNNVNIEPMVALLNSIGDDRYRR